MPSQKLRFANINQESVARWVVAIAVVILIGGGWYGWRNIYMDDQRVFWDMMGNNLATTSITRHIYQTSNAGSLDQYIQLQLGSTKTSRSLVTVKESQAGAQSILQTETVGTLDDDYSRYVRIETSQKNAKGQPLDTSKIIGVWAKGEPQAAQLGSSAQYLRNSLFGIVPYGNLTADQRQHLIRQMKEKNVYDMRGGSVKSGRENGRSVYIYEVSVEPKQYIEMMIEYLKILGLGDLGLDASQYQNSPAQKVKFTVDKLSRQLVKIDYPQNQQQETYSSQGLSQSPVIPGNTITQSELQKRITETYAN